jgi:REP element-mobilizing transposase RayT
MGYVVMPKHFHSMISEPERGDPSVVMKVLTQGVARKLFDEGSHHLKSARMISTCSEEKFTERLRYMHQNR